MHKGLHVPLQVARGGGPQPRANHFLHDHAGLAVTHLVAVDVEVEVVERADVLPAHAVKRLQAADAGLVDKAAVVAKAGADVVQPQGRFTTTGLPHHAHTHAVPIHGRLLLQPALGVGHGRGAGVQPLAAQSPLIVDLPTDVGAQHGVVTRALPIVTNRSNAAQGQHASVAARPQGQAVGGRLLGHPGAKRPRQQHQTLAAVADGKGGTRPFGPAPGAAQAGLGLGEAARVERVGGRAQQVGRLKEEGPLFRQEQRKARIASQLRHVQRHL